MGRELERDAGSGQQSHDRGVSNELTCKTLLPKPGVSQRREQSVEEVDFYEDGIYHTPLHLFHGMYHT
ncbi:hypothetical protein ACFX11_006400 [Malus domestica]